MADARDRVADSDVIRAPMTQNRRVSDRSPSTAPRSLLDMMRGSPREVPLTLALIAVNVLVFVLMLRQGAGLWHTGSAVQLAWGANFAPATQDGQWWRLGTALFLHFGLLHLGMNMWALWDVGRLIERLYGRWRFVLVYFASGVFGNLLSLVVQGNQAVSGGASGAIFALYGALLVYLWRERRQVDRGEFRWMFGAASLFTVVMLVIGFLIPGIDNAAHGGGLAAGALLARSMSKPWARRGWRNQGLPLGALVALALAVAVLLHNLPPPRYRLGEELRAKEAIQQFLMADRRIAREREDILFRGQLAGMSFDEVAGRIDATVTQEYQENFDELSALHLDPGAPSALVLENLRRYAQQRSDAAQALSEGLRSGDPDRIRKALETARRPLGSTPRAPAAAASAPASRASAP
jgi:rhomboid protease GluP